MTLQELKDRVDFAYKIESNRNLEVTVVRPQNEQLWGGLRSYSVMGAGQGIDFNSREFLIHPEYKNEENP